MQKGFFAGAHIMSCMGSRLGGRYVQESTRSPSRLAPRYLAHLACRAFNSVVHWNRWLTTAAGKEDKVNSIKGEFVANKGGLFESQGRFASTSLDAAVFLTRGWNAIAEPLSSGLYWP